MFRQVDAGFAATLYKYGRGATWGGLVMITAKWDRGQDEDQWESLVSDEEDDEDDDSDDDA